MSTVSSDLMTGFIIEAQGYVISLRQSLEKKSDPETMQEMHQQMAILSGAAEMLELGEITELIGPTQDMLKEYIDAGRKLTRKDSNKLKAAVDQLDDFLQSLTHGDNRPREAVPAASFQPLPDLPADLLEIFNLEASEHSQAIQANLEILTRNPGDQALLSELRRVTHTLKGASASIGFEVIARLAHLMEDLLESYLESGGKLPPEAVKLLFDTADALEDLIGQGQNESLTAALGDIDARYAALLGEAYVPPQGEEEPAVIPETAKPSQHPKPGSVLRLPLTTVDQLINRVGEVVINRSVLERHLGTMRALLSDLDYTTKRLGRVAEDITTQIDMSPMFGLVSREIHDDPSFDPLEMDRYSLLYQHTRELDEISADTGDLNDKLHFLAEDLDASLTRERRLTTELQNGLMNTRLVPFHELETRLRQTVRRTAHNVNKKVELDLIGFDTQVDKSVLEALADPLMHLLRNAVDHGIEAPEKRKAAHKTETGLITLRVSRGRGRVVLSLSDDGAGIDIEKIRRRAVSLGLLDEDEDPGEKRLYDFLFEEGFSLADEVTQTSGRGVGLDIVRHALNQLQGAIRIDTKTGLGTTFLLSVPVTLAITRALFIHSADQILAVPIEQISSVVHLPAGVMEEISNEGVMRHGGKTLATYNLGTFVGGTEAGKSPRYGLIVEAEDHETVVLTDSLVGIQEAVVKSLGTHLRRVHGISGATISGDGRVMLILDLIELVGVEHAVSPEAALPRQPSVASKQTSLHVLVVDDSPSVRRVVSSFLERSGWQATSAKDGLDALEKLVTARPDVALVDIEMPRMNGYELLTQMKADPALQDIPVVFLTSRSAIKHRKRAEQLLVDGYLIKPYREEELLEELMRVARR
ncbi:MAG: hybrid sensor histidine kinase/response regulator [Anaerolineae bacterium]|nr:hybrid sensor histidine kinase/response regulator [Anaerolineae bacterium]